MKKLINWAVSIIVIVVVALMANELYFKKPAAGAPTETVIVTGQMDSAAIAKALKEAGIISSTALFSTVSGLSGSFKDFHAGTFLFKEGMSVVDALKTLSYDGRQEIEVTVPEGWGIREIADRLAAAKVLKAKEEFFAVAGEPASMAGRPAQLSDDIIKDLPFLSSKPADVGLEGYLFPDTYRFYADAPAADVVKKMLGVFNAKTGSLWAPEQLHGRTIHEIVTMASILEAEVKDEADRAKVADIFFRRLDAGMPLQADSTVNYVTGKNTPSISAEDRALDSPWNTYKYKGLPPGPIGNPGLVSIRAALAPAPNKFWYFLTTPEGAVIYSQTLEEHNAAKDKYLKH